MNVQKTMRVPITILFVIMMVLIGATAFCEGTKEAAAEEEEVVTFARAEEFITLDPQDNHHLSNMIIDRLIYDRLLEMNEDGSLEPGLAKRWEVNDDETEITFYLQEGVKFHNGEPFTSESVKFTLERLRDNPEMARSRTLGPDQIDRVEIIDDYTCTLHIKQPYGPLFGLLGHIYGMLPPKAYAEKGDGLWDHPIGTGPYKFVNHVRDVELVVEANTDYWQDGMPRVDKIVYKVIKEPSTLIASILTGEVDIVDMVHPDQVPSLEKDDNIVVMRDIAWDGWFYQFNFKHPILSDVKVRTAIDLATDRERLVEIMGGGGPRWIWSCKGMVGYTPDIGEPYNPEKARQLLKETGYSPEELTFTYKVPEGWYPKMSEVAVAIQDMMKKVGINFDVRVMEGASFMDARHNADYDIFTTGAAFTDPANVTLPRVVKDQDHSGYVNEELNQIFIDAANTLDRAERQRLYEEGYRIMYDVKGPQLLFFQMETIYARQDRITGFPFSPFKTANLRAVDTTDDPGPVN